MCAKWAQLRGRTAAELGVAAARGPLARGPSERLPAGDEFGATSVASGSNAGARQRLGDRLQLAAGMNLHIFTTGRGTLYGLAAVPVIKVATRTDLARRWHDLMAVNAGTIADGTATIEQVGWELFHLMLDVASGRKKTWAEQWKLHNALVLFNPAPAAGVAVNPADAASPRWTPGLSTGQSFGGLHFARAGAATGSFQSRAPPPAPTLGSAFRPGRPCASQPAPPPATAARSPASAAPASPARHCAR